jgi:hypothetical protein
LPQDGTWPFIGLVTTVPGTQSNPRAGLTCENITVSRGHIQKRKGYTKLGATVTGIPVALINFRTGLGTEYLVLVTTEKLYYYNGGWTDISMKRNRVSVTYTSRTGSAPSAGTAMTQLNTGATGNFVSDSGTVVVFEVESSTGTWDKVAANTISGGGAVYTPDGATALTYSTGSSISFTAAETDAVDYTIVTGLQGTWLIITNGKDEPVYWDGVAASATPLRSNLSFRFTNFKCCKTLTQFGGHLILGNIKLGSVWYPNMVSWSDAASLVDFASGTSGDAILTDVGGGIVHMRQLADRVAIYGDDSITLCTYVSEPAIFMFDRAVDDIRLLSAKSVVSLKAFHLFLSRENVMLFDGTRIDRSVSEPIHTRYREEVNWDNRGKSFMFLDKPKNHVYCGVPDGNGNTSVYLLEYDPIDPNQNKWTHLTYDKRPTCMGFWSNQAAFTWNAAYLSTTRWTNLSMAWDQSQTKKGSLIRVIGFSDGTIGLADDIWAQDDALVTNVAFDGVFESVDFTIPQVYRSEEARWTELEVELLGGGNDVLTVEISMDQGASFPLSAAIVMTGSPTVHHIYFDGVSETIRVRFSSQEDFAIRWFRFWFRPVGVRFNG